MSYGRCDCGCDREISHLKDVLRGLEYRLDAMQRDLEREVENRRDAFRDLSSDIRNAMESTR